MNVENQQLVELKDISNTNNNIIYSVDGLVSINQDIEKSNRNFITKELKLNNLNKTSPIPDNQSISKHSTKKPLKNTDIRKITLNNPEKNTKKYSYIDNFVKSSIYNKFNFIPKSLFFQFKRYANIYFLFVTIIQCIPAISPLNPITAVFPFAFVLCISMLREGVEDYNRHTQDEKENSLQVLKYANNPKSEELFISEKSRNLRVGDLVKIQKNNVIPADLVILSCSNISKTAYIETSNLDGEKNLKPLSCPSKSFNLFKNLIEDKLFRLKGKINCIKPQAEINTFSGELILEANKNSKKINLAKTNLMYKGTTLKDTDWALGAVVYTGAETKIILNINKANGKSSHLEMMINRLMILIFCIQVILCIMCASGSSYYHYNYFKDISYLEYDTSLNSFIVGLISFFSYLLLFNTMIPISLVVTLEMVKYGQGFYMGWDTEMYSTLRKQYVTVNSCSLNEEMGQIKYIFSDKTGTLTTNKLVFKKAFIWDTEFGKLAEEIDNNSNEKDITENPMDFPYNEVKAYNVYGKEGKECNIELLSGNKHDSLKLTCTRDLICQFLYCISLNQTCFISKTIKNQIPLLRRSTFLSKNKQKNDNDSAAKSNQIKSSQTNLNIRQNVYNNEIDIENYEINYTGESPDEIILTKSIKDMGVVYFDGDDKKKVLGVFKGNNGIEMFVKEEFEILKVMEFNSTRGMSSIIVKKDEKIYLYSKGGDGKISLRLSEKNNENKKKIFDQVKSCSEKGYRVLCSAMKILDEAEFEKWDKELNEGLALLPEKDKDNFQNMKYEEIEKGLILLGCTVVEDKLQDLVPDTIKELQSAGINIWVLTGDNLETARNIGIMCNLLPERMQKYYLFGDVEKTEKNLQDNFDINLLEDPEIYKDIQMLIEQFEMKYAKIYIKPIDIKSVLFKEYEKNQKLKILLFVLLSKIKEKTKLENNNPVFIGVLRGLIIEMGCLNVILPPQIQHFPVELYNHPLTQLFLDVALATQAVVCWR